MLLVFGEENNSSLLIDKNKKYILFLGEVLTPRLDDTMI